MLGVFSCETHSYISSFIYLNLGLSVYKKMLPTCPDLSLYHNTPMCGMGISAAAEYLKIYLKIATHFVYCVFVLNISLCSTWICKSR